MPAKPERRHTQQAVAVPASEPEMARLQTLLLRQERERTALLEARIAALENQLQHAESMRALLAPVIGQALAERVRDARDEMAEALYPVIGKTVLRAVNEAIRDLARSMDASMRQRLQIPWLQSMRLRLRGVDSGTAALRRALPFAVQDMFVIHRESGLLIHHESQAQLLADADLVSGMLSAIRSYVHDSFGADAEGSLDAISYGAMRILIEEGSAAVLAVVIQGFEPMQFQALMRDQLAALHNSHGDALRNFAGDPLPSTMFSSFLQPIREYAHDAA